MIFSGISTRRWRSPSTHDAVTFSLDRLAVGRCVAVRGPSRPGISAAGHGAERAAHRVSRHADGGRGDFGGARAVAAAAHRLRARLLNLPRAPRLGVLPAIRHGPRALAFVHYPARLLRRHEAPIPRGDFSQTRPRRSHGLRPFAAPDRRLWA